MIQNYFPHKNTHIADELVLFIADMKLPFVLVNNPFFKLIISELGAGETAMSDTTLTTVLLPKTNKKVMDFVKSQLKDREVCMIVDAMTRYDNSYSYFLVSCILIN